MSAQTTPGVTPDGILKELAALWVSMAKDKGGDAEHGVLRACSMTLVVLAEESDDVGEIGSTVAELMQEFPSRAILVRLSREQTALSARVYSQCWMPFGQRRQICCEQIEIVAPEKGWGDLPPLLAPLTVPDLPAILWDRTSRLPDATGFATKSIIDSERFGSAEVLKRLAPERIYGDLAWTRLTQWRGLIAQLFENRAHLEFLPRITAIEIGHTGEGVPVSGYYLGAWLQAGIPQAKVVWHREERGSACVGSVRLVYPEGEFSVRQVEGQTAEILAGGVVTRTALPPRNDYSLMREELAIPGRDPIFRRTLATAAQLALQS